MSERKLFIVCLFALIAFLVWTTGNASWVWLLLLLVLGF